MPHVVLGHVADPGPTNINDSFRGFFSNESNAQYAMWLSQHTHKRRLLDLRGVLRGWSILGGFHGLLPSEALGLW